MTSSVPNNGRIPTDPTTVLLIALAVVCATAQLTTEQAQALIATGGIADLSLLLFRLLHGRR